MSFSILIVIIVACIIGLSIRHYTLSAVANITRRLLGKLDQKHPFLTNQIESVRSLANSDIMSVNVVFDRGGSISLQKPQSIGAFKRFLISAEISDVDYEDEVERLEIQIYTLNDSFTYDAFVAPSYPDDVMLKFSKGKNYRWICLPGLKRWLDENILK